MYVCEPVFIRLTPCGLDKIQNKVIKDVRCKELKISITFMPMMSVCKLYVCVCSNLRCNIVRSILS